MCVVYVCMFMFCSIFVVVVGTGIILHNYPTSIWIKIETPLFAYCQCKETQISFLLLQKYTYPSINKSKHQAHPSDIVIIKTFQRKSNVMQMSLYNESNIEFETNQLPITL